jgi:phosphate-selective porin OprO/OprP
MRKHLILGLGLVLALAVATPAQADDDLRSTIRDEISKWSQANDDNTFKVHWKNGLRLDSKNVQMAIGGRVWIDHWFVDDDDLVAGAAAAAPNAPLWDDEDHESGFSWTSLRLHNAGLLYGHVEWKLELEFNDPNEPELRDAYIGIVGLDDCIGCIMPNIRVGHQKVPHGLEALTDGDYLTFMDRSSASYAFTWGRRYAVMLHDHFRGGQLNYQLAYFLTEYVGDESEAEFDGDGNEGYGLAARITYTPWYDCECSCRRLHIGVGAYTVEDDDNVIFSTFSDSFVGDLAALATTGAMANDGYFGWNVELALVYGPFSLQAEYFSADIDAPALGDPTFTGYYAQASYWLTGECRNYDRGVFGRVSPCCNFLDNDCCCYGGIEVAVRYDFVDLTDGAIAGGEHTGITVGVNWHMNPNARIMINWFNDNIERGGVDEAVTGIGVRLQVDW